ncbi:MAG TPA: hypothetical protein VK200_09465 [Candidatus Limnocylindrales bacterium]|nr:hypothetical protein [Candidatus Limnocylindrales bacterium]
MANQFVALILDNEVTVSHFVTSPPLPWNRLIQHDGKFQIGAGYPTLLTSQQARFEMRNWDQVSLPAIMRALAALDDSVDYVVFGNNAGQGLPLAKSLRSELIGERGAVIYASSLPEIDAYRRLGYRAFFPRSETVAHLSRLAESARRPLALCFINTIQHNELNFHDP